MTPWVVPPDDVRYVERLTVRPVWWAVALSVATLGALELGAGFRWQFGLIALAVAAAPTLAVLFALSRLTVRVDERGIHAGGRTMTYDDMDSVEALDRHRTRLQAGPEADPAAFLVYRGYVATSVVVRPLRPDSRTNGGPSSDVAPYWLVSTRHPQRVVAAVDRAARAAFNNGTLPP